jgi:hypothetical protein
MAYTEEGILKADYVTLTLNALGGTHNVTFDNHQIREDVEYFDGRATEIFKTPTGEATSMPRLLAPYFKFRVRYLENEEAHNNVNLLRYLTQNRYTASFSLNPMQAPYSAFGGDHTDFANDITALIGSFSSCVIEIPDTVVDKTARGIGATKGDIEITVYPNNAGVTLPAAPPVIRLGVGDYTDLPNFTDGAAGTLTGNCISTIDGAILNTRGELLPPEAGAVLKLFFYDCNDINGTGSAPAKTDGIEFDYSADINLANDAPTGGDAAAISFFLANVQPYLDGGTGIYAAGNVSQSGELTLILDIPAFRAGGAGSITLCVDAQIKLSSGSPSAKATSTFESSAASVTMTVDDTDLEAVEVSMTATGCGGDLTSDPNTRFIAFFDLHDPLGFGGKSTFVKVYFNGGTGTNAITFIWSGLSNTDWADFETAFSPLPAGTTRGFTYNKKLLHSKGVGFDFVTNGNFTTKTTTTGANYWAGFGARRVTYADGSILQEGFEHKISGVALYGGTQSITSPVHTVRKGFLRTKSIGLRLMPQGNSGTFPNDEVRMGFAHYGYYKNNSFPADVGLNFGFSTAGTNWYDLDTAATTYRLDGTVQSYSGAANRTNAGQSSGAHTAEIDAYFIGGLRAQAYIPLSVPDVQDTANDSLWRNPAHVAYPTEIIPRPANIRVDFRIEQRGAISPAITSYSWNITDAATAASLDSGSGGSLTGSNTFSRTYSGGDIRCRATKLRIEFVYSGTTYYTETDIKIEETF